MKKRKSDMMSEKRPKRKVLSRQQSYGNGISWREETEIQKALYASLHENKKNKHIDEENEDMFKTLSDQISMTLSRNKVHAQRKFAQGSNPSSPIPTPIKMRHSLSSANAVDVLSVHKPKTEDFLTFLCLRGSSILPSSMDFVNKTFTKENTSDNRSSSPSLNDRSDNGSINGTEHSVSSDIISSAEMKRVKKPVLQSPVKKDTHQTGTNSSFRQTRSSIRSNINKKLTTKLLQKARNCKENRINSENIVKSESGINALKKKYKAKRLRSQNLVKKPTYTKGNAVNARVTRSKSVFISKSDSSFPKETKLRQAKLKPAIIEYPSSDCGSEDSAELSKSSKLMKKTPNVQKKTSVVSEHSYNKLSQDSSSKAPGKKVTCAKLKEEKPKEVPKVTKRKKSLTAAIMEAAGSATPSSSSSSSSSSDSELDIRVLRNSKKFFSDKSTAVRKLRCSRFEHYIHPYKKKDVLLHHKKVKKLKKKKKKSSSKTGKEKGKWIDKIGKRKKFSMSKSDGIDSSKKIGKFHSSKTDVACNSNSSSVKRIKKHSDISKSTSAANDCKKKKFIKRPIKDLPIHISSSSSESESDEKSSPIKLPAAKNKTEKVIDIDSLIEFSSSDDSLYEELMFLTKRASKELSPKTSTDFTPSYPNAGSNSLLNSTTVKRSLGIDESKSKTKNCKSKTMCDAATNTCNDDVLVDMSQKRNNHLPKVPAPRCINPVVETKHQESSRKCINIPDVTCNSCKPFPSVDEEQGEIINAPIYYPSVEEFKDPLEYINKISPQAERYGICTIIPPPSFKPECRVNDDMRFTSHNQYLHRLYKRWGPNVEQLACIAKHLESQDVSLEQAPLIGGIELDLCKLYESVQKLGGLQQVVEKNKWPKIADMMHIPQSIKVDRGSKLYDIYCKYLVSYDTLPKDEKQKLHNAVCGNQRRRGDSMNNHPSSDGILKGKSMALSQFYRISRNILQMWYKSDPSPAEAESQFWELVTERKNHVVVHAANIDSSVYKCGFPCSSRSSNFGKHPWNLKILTNNTNSVLKSIGSISGVTIPTLHLNMLYTAGCWYQDPHSLPWIDYLHTGSSKIWYGIPSHFSSKFHKVMKKIVPEFCQQQPLWLSSDTAMVPPSILSSSGVSVSRIVQDAGQFVVIFPRAFTATLSCGYNVSESVYFALPKWLDIAPKAFKDLNESCEPATFSFDKLLIEICNDSKTEIAILKKVLPLVEKLRDKEMKLRKQLSDLGLKSCEYLPLSDSKSKKKAISDEDEQECAVCQSLCHVSMVVNSSEECNFCLEHAITHVQKKKNLKFCKLIYVYKEDELNDIIHRLKELIKDQKPKQVSRRQCRK